MGFHMFTGSRLDRSNQQATEVLASLNPASQIHHWCCWPSGCTFEVGFREKVPGPNALKVEVCVYIYICLYVHMSNRESNKNNMCTYINICICRAETFNVHRNVHTYQNRNSHICTINIYTLMHLSM